MFEPDPRAERGMSIAAPTDRRSQIWEERAERGHGHVFKRGSVGGREGILNFEQPGSTRWSFARFCVACGAFIPRFHGESLNEIEAPDCPANPPDRENEDV